MYPRSLASFFFVAATFLFALLVPSSFAMPAEPGRTVGDVVAGTRNMGCRMYYCWNKVNGTASSPAEPGAPADEPIPVSEPGSAAQSVPAAQSTVSPNTHPSVNVANAASPLYHRANAIPAAIAGLSIILLV